MLITTEDVYYNRGGHANKSISDICRLGKNQMLQIITASPTPATTCRETS